MLEKHPNFGYCKFVSEITNGANSTTALAESRAVANGRMTAQKYRYEETRETAEAFPEQLTGIQLIM